jgi:putative transposase
MYSQTTSITAQSAGEKAAAPTSVRVLRVRVKDKHAAFLTRLSREVNTVWNYCNELSMKVIEREGRFLSGFDFWPYLKGATRGDDGLSLPVQTVQETAEQYARSRTQHRKVRLAWRKSGGARRSLGWLPFKVRTIRYEHGQIYFAGQWLSVWDSYGLGEYELRAGSFSEDSRGRWYLNVCVEVTVAPRHKEVGAAESVGMDLGLKDFAAFSDKALPPIEAKRFYRDLEPKLGIAQRARKNGRANAIHAKIRNRRKDFLHKLSTRLVVERGAIFVGNVNAKGLAQTRQAKSVLDAGWSTFRTMLKYKCADAGVWFDEVNEAYSTVTCSSCQSRTGPKGVAGLRIREWTCCECGSSHDRDVNAAKNILQRGHALLAEGIPALTA